MITETRDLVFAAMAVFIDILLLTLLAVVGWARQRRLEREAYYRHETEKRLVDTGQMTAEWIIKLRAEEERDRWRRRHEGLKLGGLIITALGATSIISLQLVEFVDHSYSALGLIPLGVGLVVLFYAYFLQPRHPKLGGDLPPLHPDKPDNT